MSASVRTVRISDANASLVTASYRAMVSRTERNARGATLSDVIPMPRKKGTMYGSAALSPQTLRRSIRSPTRRAMSASVRSTTGWWLR